MVSRGFGLLKTLAIAIFLGLNYQTDAYFFAFSLLGLLAIGAGALDSVGLPNLVKAKQKSKKAFMDFSAQLFTFVVLAALFSLILALCVTPFAGSFAGGFDTRSKTAVVTMLWIMLPYVPLFFFSQHFAALLRTQRLFTIQTVSDSLNAFLQCIIIVYGAWQFHSVLVLPLALVLAQLITVIFQAVFVKEHLHFAQWQRPQFKNIFKQYSLYTLVYLTSSVYIFIDRYFGSFLPEKAISALFYGLAIVVLPLGIIKLDQLFFTSMAEKISKPTFIKFLKIALAISFPYMVVLVLWPDWLVRLIAGYGRFGSMDVTLTAEAVRWYALALPGIYITGMMQRLLMLKETVAVIIQIALFAVLANIGMNYTFIFILHMGISGIALATSLVVYFILALQLWSLKSRITS